MFDVNSLSFYCNLISRRVINLESRGSDDDNVKTSPFSLLFFFGLTIRSSLSLLWMPDTACIWRHQHRQLILRQKRDNLLISATKTESSERKRRDRLPWSICRHFHHECPVTCLPYQGFEEDRDRILWIFRLLQDFSPVPDIHLICILSSVSSSTLRCQDCHQ